jgi:hypothetical protein
MSFRLRLPLTLVALLSLLAAMRAAPGATAVAQSGDATVNITFVACPPGGDWNGPPAGCSEVIPAPDSAMVTAAPDWVKPVSGYPQNADGSYSIPYLSGEGSEGMGLVGFFPGDFNYFTFDGVDELGRWYAGVTLAPGESRDVTVSYWNGADGLIMPAENTLVVNAFTCDEGIDPAVDASGCQPTDAEVPDLYVGSAPLRGVQMDDYLQRSGGTYTYAGLPPYTQAQVVAHQPLAGYGKVLVTGQAEVIEETSATAFLLRNETRRIDVYYYAPNDSSAPAPTETPATNAGTGTLRLMLLSCPPGVVPHDDPGSCTEAIADDGTAMVSFPETGERVALTRFERDDAGAYIIPGIQGSVTISGITPLGRDRLASDADQINGQEIVYRVDPGTTREGRLYYYDTD